MFVFVIVIVSWMLALDKQVTLTLVSQSKWCCPVPALPNLDDGDDDENGHHIDNDGDGDGDGNGDSDGDGDGDGDQHILNWSV